MENFFRFAIEDEHSAPNATSVTGLSEFLSADKACRGPGMYGMRRLAVQHTHTDWNLDSTARFMELSTPNF